MTDLITSVEPDSRGAGAAKVQVNGRWFCTIPAASVGLLELRPNLPMTTGVRERLSQAADQQAAFRFVLAALGRRSFARRDLERRLVQRGHPGEAARAALDRAGAAGLIDDATFARSYVEAKSTRGRGPVRILRDLLAMGVDRGVAEVAVESTWADEDDITAASRALALKRAAQLGNLPQPVKRRRVLAYLARRGFSGIEVREMVRRVVGR